MMVLLPSCPLSGSRESTLSVEATTVTVAVVVGLVQPLLVQLALKLCVPKLAVETTSVVLLPPCQLMLPP